MVAADRLGRETVSYVSDLYKYYIAYKLGMEDEEERHKTCEVLKNDARG